MINETDHATLNWWKSRPSEIKREVRARWRVALHVARGRPTMFRIDAGPQVLTGSDLLILESTFVARRVSGSVVGDADPVAVAHIDTGELVGDGRQPAGRLADLVAHVAGESVAVDGWHCHATYRDDRPKIRWTEDSFTVVNGHRYTAADCEDPECPLRVQ